MIFRKELFFFKKILKWFRDLGDQGEKKKNVDERSVQVAAGFFVFFFLKIQRTADIFLL